MIMTSSHQSNVDLLNSAPDYDGNMDPTVSAKIVSKMDQCDELQGRVAELEKALVSTSLFLKKVSSGRYRGLSRSVRDAASYQFSMISGALPDCTTVAGRSISLVNEVVVARHKFTDGQRLDLLDRILSCDSSYNLAGPGRLVTTHEFQITKVVNRSAVAVIGHGKTLRSALDSAAELI